jgi:uncharacterized protein with PQ loop repeat
MSFAIVDLLGVTATLYGVGGSLAVLMQARQMIARGASCDVSIRFLAVYVGGYGIWLLYGMSLGSVPIILVHAIGVLTGAVTLIVALTLRGPLLRPRAWATCD